MAIAPEPLPNSPAPEPAARGRLLDNIGLLDVPDGFMWLNGVSWLPYPCRPLTTGSVDPCDEDDTDITDLPDACDEDWVIQSAFRVEDAFKSSYLNAFGAATTFDPFLQTRMELIRSAAFAQELVSGSASGGHSLSSDATAPVGVPYGSDATPIWNALSILESEYADRTNGARGIIHIPPGLLVQAQIYFRLVDGEWQSVTGHKVVADAGYVSMVEPSGADPSGSAEDWVYISGEVRYRTTEVDMIGAAWQTVELLHNRFQRFVQSQGILVFDPCPVTAVLASYNLGD